MKKNVFLMAIAIVAAFVFISCKEQVKETPVANTKLATFAKESNGETLIGLKVAGENGTVLIAPEYQDVTSKENILLGTTPQNKFQLIKTDGTKISEQSFAIEFGDLYWHCTNEDGKHYYYFPAQETFQGPFDLVTEQMFCLNKGGWNRINNEGQTVFDFPVARITCIKDLKTDSIYYIAPTFKKHQQLYNANGKRVRIFTPKEFARFYSSVTETSTYKDRAIVFGEIKDINKQLKK